MCLQQIADVLASSRCVFNKQQKYQQQTEGVSTTNRGCFNNRGSVYNQQRIFQQQTEDISTTEEVFITNRRCLNNKQRVFQQQTEDASTTEEVFITNRGYFNNKQRVFQQQTEEESPTNNRTNDGTIRRQSWACSEQLPAWREPSRRSSAHPSARPWVVSSPASFSPPASSSRSR